MLSTYLTPASIGYLAQFILSVSISVFLIMRLRYRTTQLILLIAFYSLVTLFIGLLFLDAVLIPYSRLLAVYAQNTTLALALIFLIQFAYHFPRKYPKYQQAAIASLIISIIYVLSEGAYMVFRYVSLLVHETVYYRPMYLDMFNAFVIFLAIIAFALQCIASDPRPVNWIRKLLMPQGKDAQGTRLFIVNFGILFFLGMINFLRSIKTISTEFYNISLSIGILIALWMFASNYINFIPGGVSVQVKLTILTLTLFLAIIGSMGWGISPPYIKAYELDLVNQQTLRFEPNETGGYMVSEIDFAFEDRLGEKVSVEANEANRNHGVEFTFPFFGKTYSDLYVTSSGTITMGEPFWQPNMQARYNHIPAIFSLIIELNPELNGGVYVWEDTETNRLVVTWNQVPARYRKDAVFTIQTILYSNGTFDITYYDLPLPFVFASDETPSANPWLRGVAPGNGENLHTSYNRLLDSNTQDSQLLIENYQLDFRRYLHEYTRPMAWIVLAGSLMIAILFPMLLRHTIAKPLANLLDGIHQIEVGDLDVAIPIQNEDEIGLVTQHFNKMTARLNDLVTRLEKLVEDRTLELSIANKRLRKRLQEINSLQAELKEQSIRDPLTNAFNRRYMMEVLEKELSRAKREEHPLSLVMIDVDHFKVFNDEFGHQAGDLILQQLVGLISDHIRTEDSICRYGGEEFVILLPNTSPANARICAEELRQVCEEMKIEFNDKTLAMTISQGVVGSDKANISAGEMLKLVDKALYQAKGSGRNCVFILDQS